MSTDPQMLKLLAGLVIMAVIAIAAFVFHRRNRSKYLEQRFGPEYERTVPEMGSRAAEDPDRHPPYR